MAEAHWYVVHTYSGYENKVKANIDKTIENRHLEDQILEVRVPMQDVVEMKNGAKKSVSKKMFPGYVLINMVMNDDTWYVVRNTRGVTGFVGPGSKPVPLTDMEMKPLGIKKENIEVDFTEGDTVVVTGGVWKDTIGVIQAMNHGKQSVTINVELFGRETPVEISFADVKLNNKSTDQDLCAGMRLCLKHWIKEAIPNGKESRRIYQIADSCWQGYTCSSSWTCSWTAWR